MVMRCSGSLSDIWLTMAVKCSTDPAYDGIWVWLGWVKDFGSVIASFISVVVSAFSFGLAWKVSRITKRQKEINERTYNLNLFKERFAVWNEFQNKKDVLIYLKIKFLFERYTDDRDEFEKFNKDIFEVENILKKIKFLFISKNTPEEYNSTIDYIEYNVNIIKNSDEYNKYAKKMEVLRSILIDYHVSSNDVSYNENLFIEFLRRINKNLYFINDNLNVFFKEEDINIFYEAFYATYNIINLLKEKIRTIECCIASTVEQLKETNGEYEKKLKKEELEKEKEEHKNKLKEVEKTLEGLKEQNEDIINEINDVKIKIYDEIESCKKKCNEILEKTNIDNDKTNIKDEKFFNNVNDLMQHYLKLDE